MRPSRFALFSLFCPALLGLTQASAQTSQVSAAVAFSKARALYYTPVDNGLQGFHCDVSFDWKTFIQKSTGQPVPDTDERLQYLRSIKLSVDDDLHGTGELHWAAPTPAPEASEAAVGQIRNGMGQMWHGFFQSWNGFYTGEIVSVSDNKTAVERTGDGYHLSSHDASGLAEEQYDSRFVLQSLHVATPQVDSTTTPVFTDTPNGRIVTQLNSMYKTPATAPGAEVKMAVQYAPVNGFQIPSEVTVEVVGTASFDFHLSGCTVRTQLTPAKSAGGTPQ